MTSTADSAPISTDLPDAFTFPRGSVQETMLLCFLDRARYTRRFPGLLNDPAAAELLQRQSRLFESISYRQSTMAGLTVLLRSRNVDAAIRRYLQRHPEASILNLACGLETNFERTDNARARWYHLDLPDAARFRDMMLLPRDPARQTTIGHDIHDFAWMDQIAPGDDGGLLIVAAGIFCFFDEEKIIALVSQLQRRFPGAHLVFESYSAAVARGNNSFLRKKGFKAQLTFSSADIRRQIAAWPIRTTLVDYYPFYARLPSDIGAPIADRLFMRMSDWLQMMEMVEIRLG